MSRRSLTPYCTTVPLNGGRNTGCYIEHDGDPPRCNRFIPRFHGRFVMTGQQLSSISDNNLISRLGHLVRAERARLVEILEHLNEVERRNLHRTRGYASLFEYCVSRLKYSHSAAGRRIAAARALRRFPEVAPLLESGEVSLMTLTLTAPHLTPANKDQLLGRVRGRSQREVERLLAEYRPEARTRDRVQVVCVRERVEPTAEEATASTESTPSAGSEPGVKGPGAPDVPAQDREPEGVREPMRDNTDEFGGSQAATEPSRVRLVHKHRIQFIAGDRFMGKVEAVRALLSHRMPNASFEQVFDAAIEAYLDAHCPLRREQR
ncbi:MAG TPA: DUF222 domain-containing protein, partial [Chromatiales bacterium]|nr:DUF222 domain-containing protein [Chromatiales bacterium]